MKSFPCSLSDPFQFAYRQNRSVEDAVSLGIHFALEHLEKPNRYVRMLFVDFSSAFNTILPFKLFGKLKQIGFVDSINLWILDFLLNRPQIGKISNVISSSLVLNTGAPQGCVLSPFLYSLYTHDCVSSYETTPLIKFADDTTVEGLIKNSNEISYK